MNPEMTCIEKSFSNMTMESKTEVQKIEWKENGDFLTNAINKSVVELKVGSPDHSALGSSAVVTKSITDYPFMMPSHSCSGVAIHCSRQYIAYAINKANSSEEIGGVGMVRVMHSANGKRGLIREIKGLVMDMSFAWMQGLMLLAFTDTSGSFSVYQITSSDQDQQLSLRKVLEVSDPPAKSQFIYNLSSGNEEALNQVSWCRYIPENPAERLSTNNIPSHLLAVATGRVVELWLLHHLCGGPGISVRRSIASEIAATKALKLRIVCNANVTAVSLSPDSTCVAVATCQGNILFFQADVLLDIDGAEESSSLTVPEQSEGDCVHDWQPHDGAAVSCLLFLDDHTPAVHDDPAGSFWAFALTGAHNNTELKIWSCKTWDCLQVLRLLVPSPACDKMLHSASAPPFPRPPSVTSRSASLSPSLTTPSAAFRSPHLLLAADDSTNCIMLADQNRKVLYALLLDHTKALTSDAPCNLNGETSRDSRSGCNERETGNSTSGDQVIKRIVSISEIPVQFVPFCMTVISAKMKTYQRWKHHSQLDAANNDGDVGTNGDEAMVRGLVVHSNVLTNKSLMQCSIRLQPALPPSHHFADAAVFKKYAPIFSESELCCPPLPSSRDVSMDCSDTSSFNASSVCLKDGLSDLNILLPGAASSDAEASANGVSDAAVSHPSVVKHEIPLGALLPPHHFMTPSAAPAASAADPQTLLASATAKLPAPLAVSPPLDESMDNKPNAALAALLMCPDTRQVSALITGALPSAVTPPRHIIDPPSELSPSSIMASLLGIEQSPRDASTPKVPPGIINPTKLTASDPAVGSMGPVASNGLPLASALGASGLQSQAVANAGANARLTDAVVSSAYPATQFIDPAVSAASLLAGLSISNPAVRLAISEASFIPGSSVRSSSVPLNYAAAGCSSTSSPSLEIQQILQQNDGKSSCSSSESNSRGPTQLEVAEEDSHLPSACEEDQPEALREVASTSTGCVVPSSVAEVISATFLAATGGSPVITSNADCTEQQTTAPASIAPVSLSSYVNINASADSASCESAAVPAGLTSPNRSRAGEQIIKISRSLPAMCPSEEELQRQAVRSVHHKLLEEEYKKERQLESNKSAEQHQYPIVHDRNLCKDDTLPPSSSDPYSAVLRAFVGGNYDSSDQLANVGSPAALRDMPVGVERGVHLTCEQIEARIKGSPEPCMNGAPPPAPEPPSDHSRTTPSAEHTLPQALNCDLHIGKRDASDRNKSSDTSATELRELRSLLHSMQQQINKLNKKVDELSSNKSLSPQAVSGALRPAIETALRSEIKQTVPACVSKAVENAVNQKLSQELQRLVGATEVRLSDNISKMVHSRNFSQAIGESVAGAVSSCVTASCKDAYAKLVLPGLNSVTARTLQQFNDLFHKGTSEYLVQVKNEVSGVMACMESSKTSSVREMEAAKNNMTTIMKLLQEQMQQQQAALQLITKQVLTEAVVRRIVSEEVTRALLNLPPSVASSPSPFYGPDKAQSPKQTQLQLEQLIAAKQFNSAFKQALSANDLSQVLFVCERVNRESLMAAGNSKLSQEVLMSLINQLSHDLGQKTDLKMKFLEDAMLCIDTSHPVTRDHICSVASCLQRNLQMYLDTNPPLQTQNRFRMLLLAATHHATTSV
ncbi:enhancer of mRNA-decapping protein 4 isoform X2 [Hyalella azteca]|uniref:Enhancer of mRNA-decapping protein 4 isoform X2 n=1 Tax=Hyalella azteca TaxID=294128 RepID=A0A8B7PIF0_HYAAZ|nr:enhancer of mRNA-decapping protein 4 isoform X2 [Hyalella azteca]